MSDGHTSSGEDPEWTLLDGDADAPPVCPTPQPAPVLDQQLPPTHAVVTDQQPPEVNDSDSDLVPLDEETDDHLEEWEEAVPNRRCSNIAENRWRRRNSSSSECSAASSETDGFSTVSNPRRVGLDTDDVHNRTIIADPQEDSPGTAAEELPRDYPGKYRFEFPNYSHQPNKNLSKQLTTIIMVCAGVALGMTIGFFLAANLRVRLHVANQRSSMEKPQDPNMVSMMEDLVKRHAALEQKLAEMNSNSKDSMVDLKQRLAALEDENRDLRLRLVEGRRRCARILHKWTLPEVLKTASSSSQNVSLPASNSTVERWNISMVATAAQSVLPRPKLAEIVDVFKKAKTTTSLQDGFLNKRLVERSLFQRPDLKVVLAKPAPSPVHQKEPEVDFVMVEDVILPESLGTKLKVFPKHDQKQHDLSALKTARSTLSPKKAVMMSAVKEKYDDMRRSSRVPKPAPKVMNESKLRDDHWKRIEKAHKDLRAEKRQQREEVLAEVKKLRKTELNRKESGISKQEKPEKLVGKQAAKEDRKCKPKEAEARDEPYCYVKENKYRKNACKTEQVEKEPSFWDTLPAFVKDHLRRTADLESSMRKFSKDVISSPLFKRIIEDVPKSFKKSTHFWDCQWSWWSNFIGKSGTELDDSCRKTLTSWQRWSKISSVPHRSADTVRKNATKSNNIGQRTPTKKDKIHSKEVGENWYSRRVAGREKARTSIDDLLNDTWWMFGRAKEREMLRSRSLRSFDLDEELSNLSKKVDRIFDSFPQDPVYDFLKDHGAW